MTNAMPIPSDPHIVEPKESARDKLEQPPRTFWVQVLRRMIARPGARAGLLWIVILVFAAIFSPLLANTQPLLLKSEGVWSSPFLRFLSPIDIILLSLPVLTALSAIFLPRFSFGRRVLAAIIGLVVVIPLACLHHAPITVDWQHFRDLNRAGKVQFKLMAPIAFSPNDYLRDFPDAPLQPPSWTHPLGTDANGADAFARMIHASRIALAIGLISTGIAVAIGIVIGGLMGYFAGAVDLFGMRLIEIFEAIPTLFLLVTFVAFFGRNLYIMMAIIGLTTWTGNARFIRAEFLRLRKQDFVQSAIAAGLPLRSIFFRHLLPNGISPILVTASFGIASAILYESTLSFLGLGLVSEPSWGQMLNQAVNVAGTFNWWIAFFPGLAIFLTVFSYNLFGEALRDALDPNVIEKK
jgi:peptide/nickel transport system permease protein